ncbi:hypothetical protein RB213_012425, partial [Colletotrichum asianum]
WPQVVYFCEEARAKEVPISRRTLFTDQRETQRQTQTLTAGPPVYYPHSHPPRSLSLLHRLAISPTT